MSLKQTFVCPYDGKTKIIKIYKDTDSIFRQIQSNSNSNSNLNTNSNTNSKPNPSNIFKFSQCKTDDNVFNSLPNFNSINYFYKAKDVWEFENIGVSKPPSKTEKPEILSILNLKDSKIHKFVVVRYLICGSCDHGAFGFAAYHLDDDLIDENSEIDQVLEVGYNFESANPNHLNYFFYL
ncbi:hypothetical protein CANINC_002915 [Pichia inconspicua]|uniref:Uncharacterized protein n=1 Tax=Pichia inconspicua TaxID=52247 RepID=A0A4T0X0G0_9ASCO|nr:hypothetical protein CANINC_002915 [[Candida] inconspicua]